MSFSECAGVQPCSARGPGCQPDPEERVGMERVGVRVRWLGVTDETQEFILQPLPPTQSTVPLDFIYKTETQK